MTDPSETSSAAAAGRGGATSVRDDVATPRPPPLRRLLDLSSSLAGGNEGLSLRQMASVNEALMDAAGIVGGAGPAGVGGGPGSATDRAASIARSILGGSSADGNDGGRGEGGDSEASDCASALLGSGGDGEGAKSRALAAAQYLMRRVRRGVGGGEAARGGVEEVLRVLYRAALPLLFASPTGGEDPERPPSTSSSSPPTLRPLLDPEVRVAIVDAAFLVRGDGRGGGGATTTARSPYPTQKPGGSGGRRSWRRRSKAAPLCAPTPSGRFFNPRPPPPPCPPARRWRRRRASWSGSWTSAAAAVSVGGVAAASEATEGAAHRLVLDVVEEVCYGNADPGLVRPVTALLLPRLYDANLTAGADWGGTEGGSAEVATAGKRRRAMELWEKLSELMMHSSDSLISGGAQDGRRRCRNWCVYPGWIRTSRLDKKVAAIFQSA